jgi:primosomal protein N' (replication factor Y)
LKISSRFSSFNLTVSVAIDLALDKLFTYEIPSDLEKKLTVGQLLCVPFGHREARGFAMAISDQVNEQSSYKLKCVSSIVDEIPFFSPVLLDLIKRVAIYTASPIETVLKTALPSAVIKKNAHAKELLFVEPNESGDITQLTKRQLWIYEQVVRLKGGWLNQLSQELKTTNSTIKALAEKGVLSVAPKAKRRDPLLGRRILPTKPLNLNDAQAKALDAVLRSTKPLLLHGVTGSGKTEVYLQAIACELKRGRGAIVMVPEISLTPQTVQRFASRFGSKVAVLHSALSDGERYDEWHRIRSGEAQVVIGPRSAVWAPVKNLGLIVVDEEHDSSYKQDTSPRYNARDVAVLRAQLEGAKVVLGSATPSLESWNNSLSGKYAIVSMKDRAGAGTLPLIRLVDMSCSQKGIYSKDLLDAIKLRLERSEQTILFLNRRGYSPSVVCDGCNSAIECPDCAVAYTYHEADKCLRCHICGRWIMMPEKCSLCGDRSFTYKGIGTQRAEAALKTCFPHARVLRMDADSTSRKNSHDDILGSFRMREADVLIGTQMIAKGLDFPNVTLVGVLNADRSLQMPDFRAAERTFQLLQQVAGRAGRSELPGEVFIQTYDISCEVIRMASRGDFEAFAAEELACRRELWYPPYCHLALINLRSKDSSLVARWALMYSQSLQKVKGIKVGEAVPAAIERADGWHRWQIIVRAANASSIVKAWKWLLKERPCPPALISSIDIDALNMM